MAHGDRDPTAEDRHALDKQLSAVGWGLFLTWMGIAFLLDVGWGAGLLGVGAIVLGAQAARRHFGLPADRFGLAVGVILVVWALWDLLNLHLGEAPVPVSLFPILFIVAGIALVVSALRRRRQPL